VRNIFAVFWTTTVAVPPGCKHCNEKGNPRAGAGVGLGARVGVADGIAVGITTGVSEGVNSEGVADGIPVGITTGISEGVNVGDKLVTAVGVGVPSGDKENRVGAGVLGTR